MKKNSNALQPFFPFEFTDAFNQRIVFGGITKVEHLAMQLYLQRIDKDEWGDVLHTRLAEICLTDAETFFDVDINRFIDKID